MKKLAIIALISILALIISSLISYKVGYKRGMYSIPHETSVRVIKDSSSYITPAFVKEYLHRDRYIEVPAWDTIHLHHHDTTFIGVPYMEREYRDSTYYARIGGYKPELLEIKTFNTTKYITTTVLPAEKKPYYLGAEGEFIYTWNDLAFAPVTLNLGYDVGWLDLSGGLGYDFIQRQPIFKASLRLVPIHWK